MSSAKPMIDKLLSFKPEEFDKNIPNSNLNTLTLNNISFGYKPGELVLDKINLKLKEVINYYLLVSLVKESLPFLIF